MDITNQLQVIDRNNPSYPNLPARLLGTDAPVQLWAIGHLDLLDMPKTAFFCSNRCPGDAILGAMDQAQKWREGIGAGRILLLSSFDSSQRRLTTALSEQRNKLVAALADEVYFAHTTPGGKTARLAEQISEWDIPVKK